jgi:hypothetical protein
MPPTLCFTSRPASRYRGESRSGRSAPLFSQARSDSPADSFDVGRMGKAPAGFGWRVFVGVSFGTLGGCMSISVDKTWVRLLGFGCQVGKNLLCCGRPLNGVKRKAALGLAILAALLSISWVFMRVPYHRWRLRACAEKAERRVAGEYTRTDDVLALLRGEPKSYQDYENAAAKHEATLLHLGYFVRKEFRLANPISSREAIGRFQNAARERFPGYEWSAVFSKSGGSLTITTRKERMAAWEKFIAEYEAPKKTGTKLKCQRRLRRFGTIEASLALP